MARYRRQDILLSQRRANRRKKLCELKAVNDAMRFPFEPDIKYSQIVMKAVNTGYKRLVGEDLPDDILYVIGEYSENQCLPHRGSFEWNIDENLLDEMKNGEKNQLFESETFNVGGVCFQLTARRLYSHLGCKVGIKQVSKPPNFTEIATCIKFVCGMYTSFTFDFGGLHDCNKLVTDWNEIAKHGIIRAHLQILRIYKNQDPTLYYLYPNLPKIDTPKSFTMHIDELTQQRLFDKQNQNWWHYRLYHNAWCLSLGWWTDAVLSIDLACYALPAYVRETDKYWFECNLQIDEIGVNQEVSEYLNGDWSTNNFLFEIEGVELEMLKERKSFSIKINHLRLRAKFREESDHVWEEYLEAVK